MARGVGVPIELNARVRRLSLSNGTEIDYRVGTPPGRPKILIGIGRLREQIVLIQVVSQEPEEHLRGVLAGLNSTRLPPAPAPAPPATGPPMSLLVLLWFLSLAAIAAAMAYWWRQLKQPSRRTRSHGRIARRRGDLAD